MRGLRRRQRLVGAHQDPDQEGGHDAHVARRPGALDPAQQRDADLLDLVPQRDQQLPPLGYGRIVGPDHQGHHVPRRLPQPLPDAVLVVSRELSHRFLQGSI